MTAAPAETASLHYRPEGGPPLPLLASVRADLVAEAECLGRPTRGLLFLLGSLERLLLSRGFRVVLLYRISHTARARFGLWGRVVAGMIFRFIRAWYLCELYPAARIAGGVIIPHPFGVMIAPRCIIGPRAWIYHNVTIGHARGLGVPVIGSHAEIYPGAVIAGPVTLGDNVKIGANCVVLRDVPSDTRVYPPQSRFEGRDRQPL